MNKNRILSMSAWVVLASTGCFTTRVYSGAPPASAPIRDRQWFTIAGFVPLSSPAGGQCPTGLATAESKLSGTDILIDIGLVALGGAIGAAACSSADAEQQSRCISAGTTLAPFLLSARTVDYTCAGGPVRAELEGNPLASIAVTPAQP